jgi:hypothetical protein
VLSAPGIPGTPGTTGSSVSSPASTYTVPSGSVHADEYDDGLSAEQWGGIALVASAVVGAGAAVVRCRLGRVGA